MKLVPFPSNKYSCQQYIISCPDSHVMRVPLRHFTSVPQRVAVRFSKFCRCLHWTHRAYVSLCFHFLQNFLFSRWQSTTLNTLRIPSYIIIYTTSSNFHFDQKKIPRLSLTSLQKRLNNFQLLIFITRELDMKREQHSSWKFDLIRYLKK